MSSQLKPKITPGEYLVLERESDTRHEFFNGAVFAMAGASRRHNQLNSNLVRILGNFLADKPYSVYASDMRVKIQKINKYSYPDIVVACLDEEFEDEYEDTLLNPILIIEVLSDSTEAYDRGDKFFHYQQIESFVEYILVSQKSPHVEKFTRQSDNTWLYSEFHALGDTVQLSSIQCRINLADIYEKVKFAES